MEAGKRNITDIFNRARSLEIPFFQRAYVWKEENWDRYLSDMVAVSERSTSYFLGSVILKQRPTLSGDAIGDIRTVVDGQQRLTTTVLFFKALYDAREEEEFRATFFNLKKEIGLKHNHNDVEIFEAIVSDKLTSELRRKYEANHVLGAYDYFCNQAALLKTVDPLTLLGRVYFVGIDLGADEDEQQIFDTINSLGVSLTTAELLKNELFRRSDVDLYMSSWKQTFEGDEETREYWEAQITAGRTLRANIDLLLQSFLIIRSGANDKYAGVDNLFRSYQHFLKEQNPDKATLVSDLQRLAATYRGQVRPDSMDEALDAIDMVDRMNVVIFGLSTTTVIPYLLYVLDKVSDAGERSRMLALIETFLVRRAVCRETTKNYNNFFITLIRNEVTTYDALVKRLTGAEDGLSLIPTDAALADGFTSSNLTNAQARVVLYLLETRARHGRKHGTSPLGLRHYTVEHVMPKKWRNHWGTLPAEEAAARDALVRKLGNLTLITAALNSSIRDADWPTKKSGKGKSEGLNRFAQGLEIFHEDLQESVWNEERIQARSKRLLRQAQKAWPLPTAT